MFLYFCKEEGFDGIIASYIYKPLKIVRKNIIFLSIVSQKSYFWPPLGLYPRPIPIGASRRLGPDPCLKLAPPLTLDTGLRFTKEHTTNL